MNKEQAVACIKALAEAKLLIRLGKKQMACNRLNVVENALLKCFEAEPLPPLHAKHRDIMRVPPHDPFETCTSDGTEEDKEKEDGTDHSHDADQGTEEAQC